ncbi:hypothetical protein [Streptomyces sp. NPDC006335]|uniref:hypothetical protein n=1 Tax=Streptomyces sp. NPDC006335 TaxID=3156895 RepID=UPI0033BA6091
MGGDRAAAPGPRNRWELGVGRKPGPERAADHFRRLGHFAAIDMRASATLTRKLLDWQPRHPALIPDLEAGHYFTRA